MSNDKPNLSEVTAGMHAVIPILGAMGIEIVEADGGRAAARIPTEPNVNHFGVIYAGSLFSVAEVLGGVLGIGDGVLAMDGFVPLVKEVTIKFTRPAATAVTASVSLSDAEIARIRDEAAANGKANFELSCEVVDENGVVVAQTVGQYQTRRMG